MKEKEEGLKRHVGVLGLSANIVNIIVGAGIFVIPAIVAETIGSSSIIAYLCCGVLVALVMLCFAEVGSKVTETGGGFAYVEAAFGKFAGFLVANFAIAGGVLSDAVVANVLVDILGGSFPVFSIGWVRVPFFAILFFGLAYINVIGVKQGMRLVKINTVAKLIPLLLIVLIGWKDVSILNLYWDNTPTIQQIGEASLILFFAFQGGDVGLIVGGEIKNPKRTIPRAIFISITTVLVLYILLQTVSQGVLGSELANYKEAPLAEVARVIFGPIGFTILFIGAAISMFGALSGEVLNNPRMIYALARDRIIPNKSLAKIHANYKTPHISIIAYAAVGFLLATFGGIHQLINIASAAVLLLYLGVVFSVIQLRRIRKREPGEFEIPGGILVPILSSLIILYLLWNLSATEMVGVTIFVGLLSVIYGVLTFLKKKKR